MRKGFRDSNSLVAVSEAPVRIPRTDTSRIEPLNHDAFVRLPLLLERGEGWGEESTSFEGFMGRALGLG
jgi:hypothetical protein